VGDMMIMRKGGGKRHYFFYEEREVRDSLGSQADLVRPSRKD